VADRAGADQSVVEAGVVVSGDARDIGVSVGVGERVEDTVGAGFGSKDAGDRVNGEEGDDCRIGVQVGGNVDGRERVLSGISRPAVRRPRPRAD
jgi:hypothetical protein